MARQHHPRLLMRDARALIDELSVTRSTSNPTIFYHAIKHSAADDAAIRTSSERDLGRSLFFELELTTLAGRLPFRPIHDRTDGVDGWSRWKYSPLLAYTTAARSTRQRFRPCEASQAPIKIPGPRP